MIGACYYGNIHTVIINALLKICEKGGHYGIMHIVAFFNNLCIFDRIKPLGFHLLIHLGRAEIPYTAYIAQNLSNIRNKGVENIIKEPERLGFKKDMPVLLCAGTLLYKFNKAFFIKVNILPQQILDNTGAPQCRNGHYRIINIFFITKKGKICAGYLTAVAYGKNIYFFCVAVFLDLLNILIKGFCAVNGAHTPVNIEHIFAGNILTEICGNIGFVLVSFITEFFQHFKRICFFGARKHGFNIIFAAAVIIAGNNIQHLNHFFAHNLCKVIGLPENGACKPRENLGDFFKHGTDNIIIINMPYHFFSTVFLFKHKLGAGIAADNYNGIFCNAAFG